MLLIQEQKKALRAHCLLVRQSIPAGEKQAMDAALCRALASLVCVREADQVLGFFAVRGEPDLSPLYTVARERGIPVALPRCTGTRMTFHVVQHERELLPDRFGIMAPPDTAPTLPITARTVCILPALGATASGARLGYGGGFYDRFLENFAGICILPIYERLVLPAIPEEDTDIRAHLIVTEKGELYRHGEILPAAPTL